MTLGSGLSIFRVSKTENHPIRWNWLTLVGPDARDFLHRLTTVDARNLEVGQGTKGFFLSAVGRVRAAFTVWNYDRDSFGFELEAGIDGSWKKNLLEVIDQYTFAEKFTLTPELPLECVWIFSESEQNLPATLQGVGSLSTRAIDEELRVCHHGSQDFGRVWLSVWGSATRLEQWSDRELKGAAALNFEQIERLRISSARPWVGREITSLLMPLEAGMLDAIAQQKGCYPGQEVIERVLTQGSPPRRLVALEGNGKVPAVGEKILNLAEPPVEVGEITTVLSLTESSDSGLNFVALGFVRKTAGNQGSEVALASGGRAIIAKIAGLEMAVEK